MLIPDIPTVQDRAKFPKHFPVSVLNFSQFFQEMVCSILIHQEMGPEEITDKTRDLFCRSRRTGYDRSDFVRRLLDLPQEIHFLRSGVFRKFVDGALLPAVDGVDVGVVLSSPVSFVNDFLSSVLV